MGVNLFSNVDILSMKKGFYVSTIWCNQLLFGYEKFVIYLQNLILEISYTRGNEIIEN